MDDSGDPVTERARARVGKTLKEKWRLDSLIGVGGMAAVYAATHRNGMRVAVKVLHPELSVNPEVRSRFLREGYVANKVEHPGAVAVLDDEVTDDGAVFLVMELLEGETLSERWKSNALPADQVLLVADQMLDVLAAAHDKAIVHRDIKPDNVFLTRSGVVKLLDFGIARLRELSDSADATRSGALMGTPAYMAPEQARARWDEVDARTDLWAVGATMFKLISGRPVHEAETISEQLLSAMTNPAPSIAEAAPGVPIPIVQVVDRALAYDKHDRWPDARTMRSALRTAYQAMTGQSPDRARWSLGDTVAAGLGPQSGRGGTATTGTTVAVGHASGPSRSHGRWWFMLALAAVIGAFSFGYFGMRATPPAKLAALWATLGADAGLSAAPHMADAEASAKVATDAGVAAAAAEPAVPSEEDEEDPEEDTAPGAVGSVELVPAKPSPALPSAKTGTASNARPSTAKPAPRKESPKKPAPKRHHRR